MPGSNKFTSVSVLSLLPKVRSKLSRNALREIQALNEAVAEHNKGDDFYLRPSRIETLVNIRGEGTSVLYESALTLAEQKRLKELNKKRRELLEHYQARKAERNPRGVNTSTLQEDFNRQSLLDEYDDFSILERSAVVNFQEIILEIRSIFYASALRRDAVIPSYALNEGDANVFEKKPTNLNEVTKAATAKRIAKKFKPSVPDEFKKFKKAWDETNTLLTEQNCSTYPGKSVESTIDKDNISQETIQKLKPHLNGSAQAELTKIQSYESQELGLGNGNQFIYDTRYIAFSDAELLAAYDSAKLIREKAEVLREQLDKQGAPAFLWFFKAQFEMSEQTDISLKCKAVIDSITKVQVSILYEMQSRVERALSKQASFAYDAQTQSVLFDSDTALARLANREIESAGPDGIPHKHNVWFYDVTPFENFVSQTGTFPVKTRRELNADTFAAYQSHIEEFIDDYKTLDRSDVSDSDERTPLIARPEHQNFLKRTISKIQTFFGVEKPHKVPCKFSTHHADLIKRNRRDKDSFKAKQTQSLINELFPDSPVNALLTGHLKDPDIQRLLNLPSIRILLAKLSELGEEGGVAQFIEAQGLTTLAYKNEEGRDKLVLDLLLKQARLEYKAWRSALPWKQYFGRGYLSQTKQSLDRLFGYRRTFVTPRFYQGDVFNTLGKHKEEIYTQAKAKIQDEITLLWHAYRYSDSNKPDFKVVTKTYLQFIRLQKSLGKEGDFSFFSTLRHWLANENDFVEESQRSNIRSFIKELMDAFPVAYFKDLGLISENHDQFSKQCDAMLQLLDVCDLNVREEHLTLEEKLSQAFPETVQENKTQNAKLLSQLSKSYLQHYVFKTDGDGSLTFNDQVLKQEYINVNVIKFVHKFDSSKQANIGTILSQAVLQERTAVEIGYLKDYSDVLAKLEQRSESDPWAESHLKDFKSVAVGQRRPEKPFENGNVFYPVNILRLNIEIGTNKQDSTEYQKSLTERKPDITHYVTQFSRAATEAKELHQARGSNTGVSNIYLPKRHHDLVRTLGLMGDIVDYAYALFDYHLACGHYYQDIPNKVYYGQNKPDLYRYHIGYHKKDPGSAFSEDVKDYQDAHFIERCLSDQQIINQLSSRYSGKTLQQLIDSALIRKIEQGDLFIEVSSGAALNLNMPFLKLICRYGSVSVISRLHETFIKKVFHANFSEDNKNKLVGNYGALLKELFESSRIMNHDFQNQVLRNGADQLKQLLERNLTKSESSLTESDETIEKFHKNYASNSLLYAYFCREDEFFKSASPYVPYEQVKQYVADRFSLQNGKEPEKFAQEADKAPIDDSYFSRYYNKELSKRLIAYLYNNYLSDDQCLLHESSLRIMMHLFGAQTDNVAFEAVNALNYSVTKCHNKYVGFLFSGCDSDVDLKAKYASDAMDSNQNAFAKNEKRYADIWLDCARDFDLKLLVKAGLLKILSDFCDNRENYDSTLSLLQGQLATYRNTVQHRGRKLEIAEGQFLSKMRQLLGELIADKTYLGINTTTEFLTQKQAELLKLVDAFREARTNEKPDPNQSAKLSEESFSHEDIPDQLERLKKTVTQKKQAIVGIENCVDQCMAKGSFTILDDLGLRTRTIQPLCQRESSVVSAPARGRARGSSSADDRSFVTGISKAASQYGQRTQIVIPDVFFELLSTDDVINAAEKAPIQYDGDADCIYDNPIFTYLTLNHALYLHECGFTTSHKEELVDPVLNYLEQLKHEIIRLVSDDSHPYLKAISVFVEIVKNGSDVSREDKAYLALFSKFFSNCGIFVRQLYSGASFKTAVITQLALEPRSQTTMFSEVLRADGRSTSPLSKLAKKVIAPVVKDIIYRRNGDFDANAFCQHVFDSPDEAVSNDIRALHDMVAHYYRLVAHMKTLNFNEAIANFFSVPEDQVDTVAMQPDLIGHLKASYSEMNQEVSLPNHLRRALLESVVHCFGVFDQVLRSESFLVEVALSYDKLKNFHFLMQKKLFQDAVIHEKIAQLTNEVRILLIQAFSSSTDLGSVLFGTAGQDKYNGQKLELREKLVFAIQWIAIFGDQQDKLWLSKQAATIEYIYAEHALKICNTPRAKTRYSTMDKIVETINQVLSEPNTLTNVHQAKRTLSGGPKNAAAQAAFRDVCVPVYFDLMQDRHAYRVFLNDLNAYFIKNHQVLYPLVELMVKYKINTISDLYILKISGKNVFQHLRGLGYKADIRALIQNRDTQYILEFWVKLQKAIQEDQSLDAQWALFYPVNDQGTPRAVCVFPYAKVLFEAIEKSDDEVKFASNSISPCRLLPKGIKLGFRALVSREMKRFFALKETSHEIPYEYLMLVQSANTELRLKRPDLAILADYIISAGLQSFSELMVEFVAGTNTLHISHLKAQNMLTQNSIIALLSSETDSRRTLETILLLTFEAKRLIEQKGKSNFVEIKSEASQRVKQFFEGVAENNVEAKGSIEYDNVHLLQPSEADAESYDLISGATEENKRKSKFKSMMDMSHLSDGAGLHQCRLVFCNIYQAIKNKEFFYAERLLGLAIKRFSQAELSLVVKIEHLLTITKEAVLSYKNPITSQNLTEFLDSNLHNTIVGSLCVIFQIDQISDLSIEDWIADLEVLRQTQLPDEMPNDLVQKTLIQDKLASILAFFKNFSNYLESNNQWLVRFGLSQKQLEIIRLLSKKERLTLEDCYAEYDDQKSDIFDLMENISTALSNKDDVITLVDTFSGLEDFVRQVETIMKSTYDETRSTVSHFRVEDIKRIIIENDLDNLGKIISIITYDVTAVGYGIRKKFISLLQDQTNLIDIIVGFLKISQADYQRVVDLLREGFISIRDHYAKLENFKVNLDNQMHDNRLTLVENYRKRANAKLKVRLAEESIETAFGTTSEKVSLFFKTFEDVFSRFFNDDQSGQAFTDEFELTSKKYELELKLFYDYFLEVLTQARFKIESLIDKKYVTLLNHVEITIACEYNAKQGSIEYRGSLPQTDPVVVEVLRLLNAKKDHFYSYRSAASLYQNFSKALNSARGSTDLNTNCQKALAEYQRIRQVVALETRSNKLHKENYVKLFNHTQDALSLERLHDVGQCAEVLLAQGGGSSLSGSDAGSSASGNAAKRYCTDNGVEKVSGVVQNSLLNPLIYYFENAFFIQAHRELVSIMCMRPLVVLDAAQCDQIFKAIKIGLASPKLTLRDLQSFITLKDVGADLTLPIKKTEIRRFIKVEASSRFASLMGQKSVQILNLQESLLHQNYHASYFLIKYITNRLEHMFVDKGGEAEKSVSDFSGQEGVAKAVQYLQEEQRAFDGFSALVSDDVLKNISTVLDALELGAKRYLKDADKDASDYEERYKQILSVYKNKVILYVPNIFDAANQVDHLLSNLKQYSFNVNDERFDKFLKDLLSLRSLLLNLYDELHPNINGATLDMDGNPELDTWKTVKDLHQKIQNKFSELLDFRKEWVRDRNQLKDIYGLFVSARSILGATQALQGRMNVETLSQHPFINAFSVLKEPGNESDVGLIEDACREFFALMNDATIAPILYAKTNFAFQLKKALFDFVDSFFKQITDYSTLDNMKLVFKFMSDNDRIKWVSHVHAQAKTTIKETIKTQYQANIHRGSISRSIKVLEACEQDDFELSRYQFFAKYALSVKKFRRLKAHILTTFVGYFAPKTSSSFTDTLNEEYLFSLLKLNVDWINFDRVSDATQMVQAKKANLNEELNLYNQLFSALDSVMDGARFKKRLYLFVKHFSGLMPSFSACFGKSPEGFESKMLFEQDKFEAVLELSRQLDDALNALQNDIVDLKVNTKNSSFVKAVQNISDANKASVKQLSDLKDAAVAFNKQCQNQSKQASKDLQALAFELDAERSHYEACLRQEYALQLRENGKLMPSTALLRLNIKRKLSEEKLTQTQQAGSFAKAYPIGGIFDEYSPRIAELISLERVIQMTQFSKEHLLNIDASAASAAPEPSQAKYNRGIQLKIHDIIQYRGTAGVGDAELRSGSQYNELKKLLSTYSRHNQVALMAEITAQYRNLTKKLNQQHLSDSQKNEFLSQLEQVKSLAAMMNNLFCAYGEKPKTVTDIEKQRVCLKTLLALLSDQALDDGELIDLKDSGIVKLRDEYQENHGKLLSVAHKLPAGYDIERLRSVLDDAEKAKLLTEIENSKHDLGSSIERPNREPAFVRVLGIIRNHMNQFDIRAFGKFSQESIDHVSSLMGTADLNAELFALFTELQQLADNDDERLASLNHFKAIISLCSATPKSADEQDDQYYARLKAQIAAQEHLGDVLDRWLSTHENLMERLLDKLPEFKRMFECLDLLDKGEGVLSSDHLMKLSFLLKAPELFFVEHMESQFTAKQAEFKTQISEIQRLTQSLDELKIKIQFEITDILNSTVQSHQDRFDELEGIISPHLEYKKYLKDLAKYRSEHPTGDVTPPMPPVDPGNTPDNFQELLREYRSLKRLVKTEAVIVEISNELKEAYRAMHGSISASSSQSGSGESDESVIAYQTKADTTLAQIKAILIAFSKYSREELTNTMAAKQAVIDAELVKPKMQQDDSALLTAYQAIAQSQQLLDLMSVEVCELELEQLSSCDTLAIRKEVYADRYAVACEKARRIFGYAVAASDSTSAPDNPAADSELGKVVQHHKQMQQVFHSLASVQADGAPVFSNDMEGDEFELTFYKDLFILAKPKELSDLSHSSSDSVLEMFKATPPKAVHPTPLRRKFHPGGSFSAATFQPTFPPTDATAPRSSSPTPSVDSLT